MSDDEEDYAYLDEASDDDDDDDYDFEYSDDDDDGNCEEDGEIELENLYYNAELQMQDGMELLKQQQSQVQIQMKQSGAFPNSSNNDDNNNNNNKSNVTTTPVPPLPAKAIAAFEGALSDFSSVIQLELEKGSGKGKAVEGIKTTAADNRGEWGFKALEQMIYINFRLNRYEIMKTLYTQLLHEYSSVVTPNTSTKAINSVLDTISYSSYSRSSRSLPDDEHHINTREDSNSKDDILQEVYELTLNACSQLKNDRLWFKTKLKLGHLLYQKADFLALQLCIKELLYYCDSPGESFGQHEVSSTNHFNHENQNTISGSSLISSSSTTARAMMDNDDSKLGEVDEVKKGTQLLEVYALQIQLLSEQKDTKKLRTLYLKCLRIKSGVPHPRTIAIIQECGGKMYMREKEYEAANLAFFQSFKSYDESGDPRRLVILKYLVLASILHQSKIDPFHSQEAKPYKKEPSIVAMTNLIQAFRDDDIASFEKILKVERNVIMDDPFIIDHIQDILLTIRTQVLLKIISPYSRISIAYIGEELNNISVEEVESLLVSLLLEGKVYGYIDQVKGLFIHQSTSTSRYQQNQSFSTFKKAHKTHLNQAQLNTETPVTLNSTGIDLETPLTTSGAAFRQGNYQSLHPLNNYLIGKEKSGIDSDIQCTTARLDPSSIIDANFNLTIRERKHMTMQYYAEILDGITEKIATLVNK